jgi:acetyl esterase/lipase
MRAPTVILLALARMASAQSSPLTFDQVRALAAPPADHRVAYGTDPSQFGELRLPTGRGPFPVIEIIHGGCWLSEYDLGYTGAMAAALVGQGYAVWSIEFRRVGNPGGGWPGTFLDVAAATDHLRDLAKEFPLDTARIVAVGHSAGGQLALWLAARASMPKGSPLATAGPMRVAGVVSLEGITDLRTYGAITTGCNAAVNQVMGGTPAQYPERYAQLSPIELVPLGVPVRLLTGDLDQTVKRDQATTFADKARAAGDNVEWIAVPRAGHFDVASPQTPAWAQVLSAISAVMPKR